MTANPALRRFVRAVRHADVDSLTEAIRRECQSGLGHWQEPGPAPRDTARPATHLYEIALFGQTAIGITPQEAARNWRRCALTQIEGEA